MFTIVFLNGKHMAIKLVVFGMVSKSFEKWPGVGPDYQMATADMGKIISTGMITNDLQIISIC